MQLNFTEGEIIHIWQQDSLIRYEGKVYEAESRSDRLYTYGPNMSTSEMSSSARYAINGIDQYHVDLSDDSTYYFNGDQATQDSADFKISAYVKDGVSWEQGTKRKNKQ